MQAMHAKPFLTAEWRSVAMLNFEVEPALLKPFVPAGTELEDWHGTTLMSLVAFMFLNTRVLGWRVPMHRNFEELNLRFYVRRRAAEGWRRGVVFIKEVVPRQAVAFVARTLYGENYLALPMWHDIQAGATDGQSTQTVSYGWHVAGRRNYLRLATTGEPRLPEEGSQEQFIAEHYWGYTRRRNGQTWEYHVEHLPWRVWRAENVDLQCDAAQLYGEPLARFLAVPPVSAFLAEGSAVTVRKGTALPPD